MIYTAAKVLVTALLVVAISELGKRSSTVGALIASLPLTSLLAFIWLYWETGDGAKIAALSQSIFWYVLPSLVLFLVLPPLLRLNVGFWPALLISCGLTFLAYLAMSMILKRLSIAF